MACRSGTKCANAANQIEAERTEIWKSSGTVTVMQVDFADLESVKKFTLDFKKKFTRLDILINNAGGISIPG